MTKKYKQYGPDYFATIKPLVLRGMINRVTIKQIAEQLDMKYMTLSNMLYRNGLMANTVRYQHKQGKDVFS